VLVVEDNATNRKVIQALLGKLGVASRSVENGEEAVHAILTEVRPDLVLMDVQMPVMDGWMATECVRAWEREHDLSRLPIVALSAGAFEEDRQHCIAVGMDDFLAKPVKLDELVAILHRWLRHSAVVGETRP
jgi:CheY-like chemotaxis protein